MDNKDNALVTQLVSIGYEAADRIQALTAENEQYRRALNTIVHLMGNVDHGTKSGPNDALMRGEMLMDCKAIALAALKESK